VWSAIQQSSFEIER